MRRIKSVAVSIPCITGPYSGVNCTLMLDSSTVRKSSGLKDDKYLPVDENDGRFLRYTQPKQSIVTGGASGDSGRFETNLRDERYLPFEGAGAIGTWTLQLPKDYRGFDYATISDVVMRIRQNLNDDGERCVPRDQLYVETTKKGD